MKLTARELFEQVKKLDFEFIKGNESFLKFFYLMMGKKTCNCPNKPRLVTEEALNEAYGIYCNFNNILSDDFKKNLKIKLNTYEIQLKDKDNKIIATF